MNIGLFTETFYPELNGVATSVLTLKQNLEKQGHNVYVFTTTLPKYKETEEQVYRVPSITFKKTRRLGIIIPHKLKKTIKGLKLDIVHVHTEFTLGGLGRKTAKKLKLPLVYTMHTLYENYVHYVTRLRLICKLLKKAVRKLVISFCNRADAVIAPTQKVKDMLTEYGARKQIFTIPTGIRLQKFSAVFDEEKTKTALNELGINEGDRVLVNIGRVSQEKNLGGMLYALKDYLPAHPSVKLLIVGDGPESSNLVKIVDKLNIKGQVIFAGARPYDDIGLYYKLGHIFTAYSQSETQGLTYIEALAAGLPIVVKADKCLDGVLNNGENGYSFDTDEEFLSILDRVLFDDAEIKRLSDAAAPSAHKFSDESFADAVVSIYNSLVVKQS